MERKFIGKSRGRKLTPAEAAKIKAARADVERDKPAINAEIRETLAELRKRGRFLGS